MSMVINGTSGITFPDGSLQGIGVGRRNLIINGAMQVWQRGTSATGVTSTNFNTVDRFMANYGGGSAAGTHSIERSTDVPSGFNYSIKITHSGASATPNEYAIRTFLEMQDVKHLIGNTAVFSFYYKSSRTGTHAYRFSHNSITGASSVNGTFTVTAADTWERKEIVITQLESATGTSTADTSWGIHLDCGPRAYGGVSSFDDGDYFAVTGVQLEVGSVATPFEHRSYGEELALCQRYYYVVADTSSQQFISMGDYYVSTQLNAAIHPPVTMRSTPTLDQEYGTGYFGAYSGGGVKSINGSWALLMSTPRTVSIYTSSVTSGTAGDAARVYANNGLGYLALDSEL
jgi:hypothetical protein